LLLGKADSGFIAPASTGARLARCYASTEW